MAHDRILVAQMTRMGDVLQTSPLVRALKKRYPNAAITAMVRRMGKPIAECNPDISDVIVYEEDDLFLDLRSEDPDRLLKAYRQTDALIQRLKSGNFDVVYNCTHSLCSAMLFKLAEIPQVVGAHLSDDWRYVWRGRGPNYFITSVLNREANDLNVCDSFRYFMENPPATHGLQFHVDDQARAEASAILAKYGLARTDFLVCMQLGASDRDKRWPEERFAELARSLVQKYGARIVLLGVDAEAPLGAQFERYLPDTAVHLFGQTTIPQLAAILEWARVLVTNDTGTMHIAAAVKCPVVLVSVGYVHFRETGPYGAGHCAVEARRQDVGRSDIRGRDDFGGGILPHHVARAVDLVTAPPQRGVPCVPEDDRLSGVDIHWSGFAPDGCLQWYPVMPRPATSQDITRMAYRLMWIEYLEGTQHSELEEAGIRQLCDCYARESGFVDATPALNALDGLRARAENGEALCRQLMTALIVQRNLRRAKELVDRMVALDEDIRVYGEINRVCRPLVAIARFERDNLEGFDPLPLAERTLAIYQGLAERSTTLARKLRVVTAQFANANTTP